MINLRPGRGPKSLTSLLLVLCSITTLTVSVSAQHAHDYDYNSQNQRTYGLDISFPITTPHVSTNFDYLPHNNAEFASPSHPNYIPVPREFKHMALQRLGDRQFYYDHFMEGCRHHYAAHADYCDETEEERMDMNLRQPPSMMNYTELGFAKVAAPKKVVTALQKFWKDNHGNESPEEWDEGNTYTNHWEAPTFMLNIDDSKTEKIWSCWKQESIMNMTINHCSMKIMYQLYY